MTFAFIDRPRAPLDAPCMRSPKPLVVVAFVALMGCGAGGTPGSSVAGARSEGPPAGSSNDNVPPLALSTPAASAETAGSEARPATGEILVPGPGFSPSPIRASGVAGGPTEGSSSASGCTGNFPTTAQHVLKISRRVPQLRVMVDGVDHDLTLAIHAPDGRWLCNDDSGDPMFGLNPAVDIPNAGPGEFEVFVGTFSAEDQRPPYTIGVTEDLSRNASSMRDGQASPSAPSVPSPSLPF